MKSILIHSLAHFVVRASGRGHPSRRRWACIWSKHCQDERKYNGEWAYETQGSTNMTPSCTLPLPPILLLLSLRHCTCCCAHPALPSACGGKAAHIHGCSASCELHLTSMWWYWVPHVNVQPNLPSPLPACPMLASRLITVSSSAASAGTPSSSPLSGGSAVTTDAATLFNSFGDSLLTHLAECMLADGTGTGVHADLMATYLQQLPLLHNTTDSSCTRCSTTSNKSSDS
jgi:hypothetical protein